MSRRGLNLEISWTGKNGVALSWGEEESEEKLLARKGREKREKRSV